MKKSSLFKIAGAIVASFVVITIGMFFLYPYLNEENYEKIQAERSERQPVGDYESDSYSESLSNAESGSKDVGMSGLSNADSSGREFEKENGPFQLMIDSLTAVNDSLVQQLETARENLTNIERLLEETGIDPQQIANARRGEGDIELMAVAAEPREEFSERVKSLLNLDEEELTPIANQMSQQELVKIYSNSGNIQREKLLRSLSAERAAKLMKEIML